MRSFILLAVFSSMVVNCKSVAREPDSQPEFAALTKKVQKILTSIISDTPSQVKASIPHEELDSAIVWVAEHGRYTIFKDVVDSVLKYDNNKDYLRVIVYRAVRSRNSAMKVRYLLENGVTNPNSVLEAIKYHGLNNPDNIYLLEYLLKHGGDKITRDESYDFFKKVRMEVKLSNNEEARANLLEFQKAVTSHMRKLELGESIRLGVE